MSTLRHALLVGLVVALAVPTGSLAATGAESVTDTGGQADGIVVQRTHPSADLSAFDAVVNASLADTLDRSEVAVRGDLLVIRLDRAGIGAAIANASGENATQRYRSWLEREDTSLSFAPVNESGPALVADGSRVRVRSGTFDGERRTYLVVPTAEGTFVGNDSEGVVGLDYRFTARDGNATLRSDPVTFVEPSVTLTEPDPANDTLSRPSADVLARTTLPTGTPVTVSVVDESGVVSTTTVPLEPPNTMEPDRFTRLDAKVDTAAASRDARLVVSFANRGYPYEATLFERNVTVAGEPLSGNLTVETMRARGDLYAELTNASGVHAARDRGELIRSALPAAGERTESAFVRGDLLVVRLEGERLAATLRARNGATPTDRFRDYLHDTDAALRILQTPDTTTPERQPKNVRLRASRFRVVADGDTRWVLLDTGNLTVTHGVGEESPPAEKIRPGEAFDVSFGFPDEERIQPTARDRVTVARHHVDFDLPGGDGFYTTPGAANVTVRSTLAPGTAVTVVLERGGEFVRRTVELTGRNVTNATAQFDLPNATDGDTLEVGLYVGHPSETELRVGNAGVTRTALTVDEPSATLRIAERSPAALTVTGELSRGGVLRLETVAENRTLDTDLLDSGRFESRLTLPASVTEPTAVRVVAYRSVEGTTGGERLYRDGTGDPVSLTLTLDPGATDDETHTPETPPPTRTPDGVPDLGTTIPVSDSTGGDGAGFGPLAAGVAVLALTLVARRR